MYIKIYIKIKFIFNNIKLCNKFEFYFIYKLSNLNI